MTRATIRERLAAATPGPWRWGGNLQNREVYLSTQTGGRVFVLRVARWGMNGARFLFQSKDGMVGVETLARLEKPYRADVADIDHPDAALIAHAPTDLAALLAVADAVVALDGDYIRRDDRGRCEDCDAPRKVEHAGTCAYRPLIDALAALEAGR